MGLALGYFLSKRGELVEIFEADDRVGGMSAIFDFGGLPIERYYHFVCGPDRDLFRILDELGLSEKLRWTYTRMGFYFRRQLHEWGNPKGLLAFPHLDLKTKLRYAAHVMRTKNIRKWAPFDKLEASEWLRSWLGDNGYEVLWRFLFEKKFYDLSYPISAAWVASRIRRIALSRKSIFKEQMGYLEGGSEVLLDKLCGKIEGSGGKIHLNMPVRKVLIENGKVRGIATDDGEKAFDAVFSTVPLPYLPDLAPSLPPAYLDKVRKIQNVGVVCVILKLKYPFTGNFWLNINNPDIEIPGLIEYSNLRPVGESILYAPFYMPPTHPKWARPEEDFVAETIRCLEKIRPDFKPDWVVEGRGFRYQYAQPICRPGLFDALPPMETGISGFFAADTTHSYPEDRSINESVRIAGILAEKVM